MGRRALGRATRSCPIITRTGSDERGAILVIALFFAVFLVSLLYAIVGTAQAVFQREHLQDAVDATALSGAIVNAQAMNLLVLLNLVMAALLSILVALKAVELLCMLGIGLAVVLAYFTGGASLSLVPPLNGVRESVVNVHDSLKDPIFQALATLKTLGDEIKVVAPEMARLAAESKIESSQPAMTAGFVWAKANELPVGDDDYSVLCGKAGKMAADLAMLPITTVTGTGEVSDLMSHASGEVVEGLSSYFCGDSSSGTYSYPKEQAVAYPRTDFLKGCETSCEGAKTAELGPDCKKLEASNPDPYGACKKSGAIDCGLTGPYETRVRLAREQCDPSQKTAPFEYSYQLHRSEVIYRWNKKVWVRLRPRQGTYEYVSAGSKPPCGPSTMETAVAHGYRLDVHPAGDISQVNPLCTTEERPAPPDDPSVVQDRRVHFVEVTHLLGCKKMHKKKISVATGDGDGNQEDKRPKRIAKGTHLGDPQFRFRVVAGKDPDEASIGKIIRLSLWGDSRKVDGGGPGLMWLRRFGYGASEYFYDGTDGASEYLWNMNWKARLVRFDLPEPEDERQSMTQICSHLLAPKCARLFERFFINASDSMH